MKPTLPVLLAILGVASAQAVESNFDGSYWLDRPIVLAVDVSGATAEGSADAATLSAAVTAAAAKWNAALKLPIFEVRGEPVPSPDGTNNRNEFYFSSQISPASGFATQFGAVFPRRTTNGCLLEGDLIFNPEHRWLVYRGPLQYETNGDRVPDLYRVALHEMGHLLGMVHPASDSESTIMRSRMSDIDDLTPMDLQDAARITEALLEHNHPRVTSPRNARASTRSSRFILRGTANPFFMRTITLKITSTTGVKNRTLRLGTSWKRAVPLAPGVNRLRFTYRTPDGTLMRFATKFITVRP